MTSLLTVKLSQRRAACPSRETRMPICTATYSAHAFRFGLDDLRPSLRRCLARRTSVKTLKASGYLSPTLHLPLPLGGGIDYKLFAPIACRFQGELLQTRLLFE